MSSLVSCSGSSLEKLWLRFSLCFVFLFFSPLPLSLDHMQAPPIIPFSQLQAQRAMEPYVLPFCLNPNFGVTRRVNGKERCSKWSLCISTRVVGGLLAACYTPPPTKHHHPFKLSCQHDHETRCWVCTDLHFSPKNQDVGEGQHLVFVKESVGYRVGEAQDRYKAV